MQKSFTENIPIFFHTWRSNWIVVDWTSMPGKWDKALFRGCIYRDPPNDRIISLWMCDARFAEVADWAPFLPASVACPGLAYSNPSHRRHSDCLQSPEVPLLSDYGQRSPQLLQIRNKQKINKNSIGIIFSKKWNERAMQTVLLEYKHANEHSPRLFDIITNGKYYFSV